MRLRMLSLVAVGVLCGGTALAAQKPVLPGDIRAKAGEPKAQRGTTVAEEDPVGTRAPALSAVAEEDPWYAVAVSPAKLNTILPLFTAESGGTGMPLDRMAKVGMNKTDYVALKNSLIVARLDASTPSRLKTVTGTQLRIRQANVSLYNANKTRLEAVVSKLHSDGPCGPCSAGAAVMEVIKR